MKKIFFTIFAVIFGAALAMPALALDAASGASIEFGDPSPATLNVNTVFEIKVNLTTGGSNVDEIDLEITFPKDKLQLESAGVSKGADFQTGQADPSQSALDGFNQNGKIQFDVKRSANLSADGEAAILKFKAMAPGDADLHFTDNTFAYETDVKATDKTLTIAGVETATPTTAVTFVAAATPTTIAGTQTGPSALTGTGPEDILLFSLAGALGLVLGGWVILKARSNNF